MKYYCHYDIKRFVMKRIKLGLTAAVLIAAALIMLLHACSKTSGKDAKSGMNAGSAKRFESGTVVEGVDISDMTVSDAKKRLEEINERIKGEYTVKLNYLDESFTLGANTITVKTDIDTVLENALTEGGGEYALSARAVGDSKLDGALKDIASSIDTEGKEARLITVSEIGGANAAERNERFALTEAVSGVKVDIPKAKELVLSGEDNITIPVSIERSIADAPALPERLAIFYTSFASGALSAEGRVKNIEKAAALINNTKVIPGENFSCNEALGEREPERGWAKGTAFASGGRETRQQYGGGICQVSTTLYNCALLSGLETVERHGHSRRVAYIDGGRDASLVWGASDLIIKNNTASPIYIYMWVDEAEKRLFCEIYGERSDEYDEIEILSELIEKIEPAEPEFETDASLSKGECVLIRSAITGSRYSTHRVYKKLGRVIRRESIDETTYVMLPALYAVPPEDASSTVSP